MSRLVAALLAATALLSVLAANVGASVDPVRLALTTPAKVALRTHFTVGVRISADVGAFDIAAQPLRLHVLLEPECGGSFEGSTGPKVIDRPLPAPTAGKAYTFTARARSALRHFSPQTLCVFVTDAEQRQFGTSTEVTVAATRSCTRSTRRLTGVRRALKRATGDRRRRLRTRARSTARRKRSLCPRPTTTS